MPFASQFALSLELTKLIPLVLDIGGRTYESAMRQARELQNSGSDIVVEEDMAELFGRSRITDNVASSFRTIVSSTSRCEDWHGGLGLYQGAGPTVVRALTETTYFSTIVQCSFLVHAYERNSLATAITNYFEQIAGQSSAKDLVRASPSRESVLGMLRACEDQTAAFNWRRQLLAVAAALGENDHRISHPIPMVIMHGLIPMLPIVQRLPEDRCIVIRTSSGICSIVTWAHVLLGLSVIVRDRRQDHKNRDICFPTNNTALEHVVILLVSQGNKSSIALLAASTQEELFKLKEEPDDENLDATSTAPARGIARKMLLGSIPRDSYRQRVLHELGMIACAFSICIAEKLSILPREEEYDHPGKQHGLHLPNDGLAHVAELESCQHVVEADRIFESARFLFDQTDQVMDPDDINAYAATPRLIDINKIEAPRSFAQIFKDRHRSEQYVSQRWIGLRPVVIRLSVMILAFAHVSGLEKCAEMPICDLEELIARSDLTIAVEEWDGVSSLRVRGYAWLQVVALLMVGTVEMPLELHDTSLVSNRGWSVFVDTFGDPDPSYIRMRHPQPPFRKPPSADILTGPGGITIRRGVPWRNGVWRHRVKDATRIQDRFYSQPSEPQAGNTITDTCPCNVTYDKTLLGERGDCFLVTVRIRAENDEGGSLVHRTGYYDLWCSAWTVQKTTPCTHRYPTPQTITLQPGWHAPAASELLYATSFQARLIIHLTAGNKAARWRALSIIPDLYMTPIPVLLRTQDCCLECATTQASRQDGPCHLVL